MTIQLPRLRGQREQPPAEAPVPAAEPAPQAGAPAPDAALPAGHALARPDGGRVDPLTQCLLFARHACRDARRRARDASSREGNWVSGFLAAKPPSVNEQRSYLASRGWLPPGHEGGIADRAGEAYQVAYGSPGVALGNAIALTFKRGYRFAITAAVLLVALFAACRFVLWLPPATCVLVPGALAGLILGWLATVAGVLAARRALAQWRAQR